MAEQELAQSSPELELLEDAGVDLSVIRRVPLEKIARGRFQPRRHFDPHKLQELADDIRANGQAEPGILNELPDGKYELIAGERRFRALGMLGRKSFRAVIVTLSDMQLIMKLAWASNGSREDLNDLDLLESALEMRSAYGMSDTEIGKVMNRPVQWVSNTLSLDRLHGKIRPHLGSKQRGGISRSVALQLVRVEPTAQLTVLKTARKGDLGEKRVRRLIDQLLADDEVRPHPDAQNRSTPTEAFRTMVHGKLRSAREAVEATFHGSRRKKLQGLDEDAIRKIREEIKGARDALDCLESVFS